MFYQQSLQWFLLEKIMNINSKVTREGGSGYTQTYEGYLQRNMLTSVCEIKWRSAQFSPLDEAECGIFKKCFSEKENLLF